VAAFSGGGIPVGNLAADAAYAGDIRYATPAAAYPTGYDQDDSGKYYASDYAGLDYSYGARAAYPTGYGAYSTLGYDDGTSSGLAYGYGGYPSTEARYDSSGYGYPNAGYPSGLAGYPSYSSEASYSNLGAAYPTLGNSYSYTSGGAYSPYSSFGYPGVSGYSDAYSSAVYPASYSRAGYTTLGARRVVDPTGYTRSSGLSYSDLEESDLDSGLDYPYPSPSTADYSNVPYGARAARAAYPVDYNGAYTLGIDGLAGYGARSYPSAYPSSSLIDYGYGSRYGARGYPAMASGVVANPAAV
jgi:hypothetical protein